jgi:hypothetical protein
MIAPPTPSDATFGALHSAGWSIGDVGGPGGWIVSVHRGDQTIEAHGRTQSEAWSNAVELAGALPAVIVSAKTQRQH